MMNNCIVLSMSGVGHGPNSALHLINDKTCNRCHKGVLDAYIKCIKCDDHYHKSCFQVLVNKGRKFNVLSGSMMVCERHDDEMTDIERICLKIVDELKKENQIVKMEIESLKKEVNNLKTASMGDHETQVCTKSDIENMKDELVRYVDSVKSDINRAISTNLSEKFVELENSLFDKQRQIKDNQVALHSANGYSDAVKKKQGMIIQPEDVQPVRNTLDCLRKNVSLNQENIGVAKVKPLRNGGIFIECNKNEDVTKLHNKIESVLGENYDVRKTTFRNPMIKIVGLSENIDEEQLKLRIVDQNPALKDGFKLFKLVVCKKMVTKFMAIVEVDCVSFKSIMTIKNVFIGFDKCNIYEHFRILRCYGCGDYNHVVAECKNEKVCLKCGSSTHSERDCDNNSKCVNCVKINKSRGLNLDTDHACYDPKCEALNRQIMMCKQKTQYDS